MSGYSGIIFLLCCAQSLEKRFPDNPLQQLAVVFDPGVRALILSDDESTQLLTETHMELMQSRLTKLENV